MQSGIFSILDFMEDLYIETPFLQLRGDSSYTADVITKL